MVTPAATATRHRGAVSLWLRWSWRDLRAHFVAVIAIALVMAIGTGVYAGLGSTSTWRRLSNDASFAQLAMHDLRIALSPGTFTDQGTLDAVVADIDDASSVTAANERLVVDSQLDASTAGESILVSARIVGMRMDAAVDTLWVRDGDAPRDGATAVLEAKFADAWDLDDTGTVTLAGDQPVDYRGLGIIPEDYYYEGPEGSLLSQGALAPLYMDLAQAQRLVRRADQVNDLVLTIAPDADRSAIRRQLVDGLDAAGVSATVTTRDDATAFRLLYDDIENDQRFWNVLAGLVLLAATLASFNLISRIVEAQRREIGIGMALGVARWKLGIRPMLVGVQVSFLGTVLGIVVGLLVGAAMKNLLAALVPMPAYRTPFQFGVFARAALLGLVLPIAASVLPLWRALRVEPIEAIRTGHLTAKVTRLTDWTRHVALPGSSFTLMPLRNIMRTPRRTMLTAVGVGAAITALVAVLGMLDSFGRTIDEIDREFGAAGDDRVLVQLDTFYPTTSDVVGSVADAPSVGDADQGLRLPIVAIGTGVEPVNFDLLVELVDLSESRWRPTLDETVGVSTSASDQPGIILAHKAATDLGVGLGERIMVRHPSFTGSGGVALVESEFVVTAIHANPIRTFAYMDIAQADLFGLAGTTNLIHAYPGAGRTGRDVQQDLFGLPGVASSEEVARIGAAFDEALAQFVGFLVIAAVSVLALALLIAFNSSRITIEERRREHATMRAFGVPVRTILALVVKESVVVGLAATAFGVVTGALFLGWMLRSLATTTLPDLGMSVYLSPATLVVAACVGVIAVAIAPLFLIRRISRMNIPDTLRVME